MNPFVLLLIGLIIVLGGILVAKWHPILALLLGAVVIGALTSDAQLQAYALSKNFSPEQVQDLLDQSLGKRIAAAFGNTCEKIGLLIALASIIGKCLLDSGGAERIVRSMLGVFGEKRAPFAFMVSSFALAIPIFFDTVFYLMIPLARAMGIRKAKAFPVFIMAIVAGAAMAHSLVPPTPGPLFAASALGVGIGIMMIIGSIVGIFASGAGLAYAFWINRRQDIPLRNTSATSVETLKNWLEKDNKQLPSPFLAHLPIVLPLLLIAGNTITQNLELPIPAGVREVFRAVGDPVIALLISTLAALYLLSRQFNFQLKALKQPMEAAVSSAGIIILITAMGGAFGAMLQQTSIGNLLIELSPDYQILALPMAWFIAALIRTAQGSATVAIITAVGMLTAFGAEGVLNYHPVYLAVAIGCGSKLFPWMNDSGFWIVGRMSGFTEGETFRNFSFLMTVMAVAGLIVTMILASLFPLI
ncbi:GntP family permease [Flavilitoribacter nigricans]|uniref:Gluconate transporter n=1 Tax=Flavilitoribacter nigricans (strain ATCC 23147 / DSM 23189 / NBRC 102662 / NCIMB 1420 / SS-2) TaxID=1122177 RepID=A0A2D0NA83_FLAN2|nr:SLC13 family permease [Flavilitoribacter nigricans]PHN05286.1 gluconate transporter [Flavilitoribacter nigricans DSM 23189 = NBRC 102662]